MSEAVHDGPSRLEELALNNTGIDDDAAQFLACCSSLVVLEVAGTKLTSPSWMASSLEWYALRGKIICLLGSGLFPIIDACSNLEKLDLTSCRGIKVADRRRFFEVTIANDWY